MITPSTLVLPQFGAACAASLLVAFALSVALRRTVAGIPGVGAHRSVWLLAQGAVVLVFALAWAPLPRSAIAPVIKLAPVMLDAPSFPPPGADTAVATPTDLALPAMPTEDKLANAVELARDVLPAAWLGIYLVGLAWQTALRLHTRKRWTNLLLHHSRSVGAADLRAWPAITQDQLARIISMGLTVRTTDLAVSPMLLGLWQPCLLLPAHLSTFDAEQGSLIVAHELAHYKRADHLWLLLSGILGTVFWFNRPLQKLDAGLRDAVELGCDDAVLSGRSAGERRSYAGALVAQLRMQLQWQAQSCAPAFGGLAVAARVQRMKAWAPPRLSTPRRTLAAAAMFGFAAAVAALQPAFSSDTASMALPAIEHAALVPPAGEAWRYPLDEVRVTALFGVRSPIVPSGHHGVDLAARHGTPVLAVAGGIVAEAAFNPTWGHYVRVDHGGGISSLLIHLERVGVAYGQRIAAGDVLGASGSSGRATGPHLHLEYWRDGRRLDPQIMLPGLSDFATPSALALRQLQNNPINKL